MGFINGHISGNSYWRKGFSVTFQHSSGEIVLRMGRMAIVSIKWFDLFNSFYSNDTTAEAPPAASNDFERPMHSPPDNEKVVKRGRKQKQGSGRNTSLESQNCSEDTSATGVPNADSEELLTPTSKCEVMESNGVSVGKPSKTVRCHFCLPLSPKNLEKEMLWNSQHLPITQATQSQHTSS